MPAPTFTPHRCRGFTLVETIIVMVVTAIAAVTIAIMSGNIFNSQNENKNLQIGLKLMQECAEHVLAQRRAAASLSAFAPDCATLPALPTDLTNRGFAKAVAAYSTTPAGNPYTGAGCPVISGVTAACKLVTVTVAMPAGLGNINPLTLLLVE